MAFSRVDGYRPIEELTVPFDSTQAADKAQRRRRLVRSRLVSLIITVVILGGIYLWQRDQSGGAGSLVLYAVVLGISLLWFLASLVAYLRAKRALRQVGTGTAVRIGRPGVEVAGVFVPWGDVSVLAAVRPGRGRSPVLRLTRANGEPLTVPLDQISVRPATLDLTARAYSAGRHGVDLEALE